ncbi:MAG: DUF5131 family protein [Eubacteriales bacterium]|nr:DUF5131 family protein [Eubacteriales bacterium]MDD4513746.1 DUF5131 family protein [Eubacteriales bacterium]
MGDKTKIDWADASWNPVTGCLHGCEYCYARQMAHRYAGQDTGYAYCYRLPRYGSELIALDKPMHLRGKKAPYPFDFAPTFHRYRLDIPARWQRPRNIFVCSMADLFGEWVPDEWIAKVFKACEAAPQHRYLFLTKNPIRYSKLKDAGMLVPHDNWWFGSTMATEGAPYAMGRRSFVSIEPILAPFDNMEEAPLVGWVIIGAETGARKGKVVPEKRWIDDIALYCKEWGIPVFMKESLRKLMGDDFRQEYPWDMASPWDRKPMREVAP